MRVIDSIGVWGDPIDEGALQQIRNCAKTASKVALMADHHRGYSVPIGGVVAYQDQISPSGVGYDIACGNKAVKLDIKAGDIHWVPKAMDSIWKNISFGIGRKNNETIDHNLFDDRAWQIPSIKDLRDKAAKQLGTIGSGNHYVDLLMDEEGFVWVGVHFGSRGFGHDAAKYYLDKGGANEKDPFADPLVFNVDSEIGLEYITVMRLAGEYAYAGRDWVCQKVASLLGASILEEVHNHHNYAWLEHHNNKNYWVVRKGATPAFEGQKGFVGGSMGEPSVILEGVDSGEADWNLSSTVHGAGRAMSRTQAAGKIHRKTGKVLREGIIATEYGIKDPWELSRWLKKQDIILRGAGLDEAPQAYKRLNEVLEHHKAGIKILHTLTPLGVAMAGVNEYDPYKD